MAGKTSEAQLRASKKYNSKFVAMRFRATPAERDAIMKHLSEAGDVNISAFIKRAITETMDRDITNKKVANDYRKT